MGSIVTSSIRGKKKIRKKEAHIQRALWEGISNEYAIKCAIHGSIIVIIVLHSKTQKQCFDSDITVQTIKCFFCVVSSELSRVVSPPPQCHILCVRVCVYVRIRKFLLASPNITTHRDQDAINCIDVYQFWKWVSKRIPEMNTRFRCV